MLPYTLYCVLLYSQRDRPWADISKFFNTPPEYAANLGAFRSPLLFLNGKLATSESDWKKRRAEIRKEWMDLMGVWPPVIDRPKMETLSESHRENFVQK